MKKRFYFFALLMPIFFTSCNNSQKIATSSNESNYIYISEYADNYKNGRVIGGYQGNEGTPSMYLDYSTMESTVLCSKPNCRHNTDECVSHIIGKCPLITNDAIYFFSSNCGVNEEKDGNKSFYIDSKLCKVSLNTSEIETICTFTDSAPADSRGYVLYNDRIYFTSDNMDPIFDDYGAVFYSNIGGIHYLCCIDLTSGEYHNLGSIYDGDKEYESAESSSSAKILGIYDNKMLIDYEFSKSYNDLSLGKYTDIIFEYSFETDTLMQTDINSYPIFVDSDTLCYYDEETQKCVLVKSEEKLEFNTDMITFASVQNNKLFIRDDKNEYALKWYDLSDLSEHSVEDMNCFMPVSIYDNNYILTYGDKTIKLTEEELLALDKE